MFEWADGSKYEGSWDAGKQHGQGCFYKNGVITQKGEWTKGKFVEQGQKEKSSDLDD